MQLCYSYSYLEFNVPFQHKYGYIKDENAIVSSTSSTPVGKSVHAV